MGRGERNVRIQANERVELSDKAFRKGKKDEVCEVLGCEKVPNRDKSFCWKISNPVTVVTLKNNGALK